MTDIEAISCLKADKEYLVDNGVCDGEEIDIAINALEKNIPKKQGNIYADGSHLYIERDGFARCFKTKKDIRYPLMSLKELDYCPRCGQKLEWESDTY